MTFEPGNFYVTRRGLKARVERIGISNAKKPGPFPLTGWVEDLLNKSKPMFECWTPEGFVFNDGSEHPYDLVGPWVEPALREPVADKRGKW